MGLILPMMRLIARAHREKPVTGPILTLGRQAIYASFDEVCAAWRAEGLQPLPLPQGASVLTDIPAFKDGPQAGFTNDKAVFLSLTGISPVALDESSYEGAEYIVDLNKPIPAELEDRFDLIVDAGTMEHVFDVKQGFQNLTRMLRDGGRIVHSSPANNWLQHGFYQFSPTFFYDYYGASGFSGLRCYLIGATKTYMDRGYKGTCDYWEWNPQRPYFSMFSDEALTIFFVAEKVPGVRSDVVPQQGQYLKVGMGGRLGDAGEAAAPQPVPRRDPLRPIKRLFPEWFKQPLRDLMRKDPSVKPWGLRYLGKI